MTHQEHLALIARLWQELEATEPLSKAYDALIVRIRRATDAYRDAPDDPPPQK